VQINAAIIPVSNNIDFKLIGDIRVSLYCDEDQISTSHIERFNHTCRMSMRRFTRLTNGRSKCPDHHTAMQAPSRGTIVVVSMRR
jgi:hypothetical protein